MHTYSMRPCPAAARPRNASPDILRGGTLDARRAAAG